MHYLINIHIYKCIIIFERARGLWLAFAGANAIINCDSCGKIKYNITRGERGELRPVQFSGKRGRRPFDYCKFHLAYFIELARLFPGTPSDFLEWDKQGGPPI